MDDAEVITRVVAILTKTREWVADDSEPVDDESDGIVGELVKDLFPSSVAVPPDATPQQVASALSDAISPAIYRVIAVFTSAFHQLAIEHDQHDPEVTSAEVLQDLALHAQSLS